MAGGDEAHLRVLRGRLVNHAGDETLMIQDWAAVAVLSIHGALLCW
jgi:hypothetical protein